MTKFMFEDNKKNLDSKSILDLNYIKTTIKDTDVSIKSNKTLSITYDNDAANHPKIYYPNNKSKYNSSKIYIYGVLHNNIKDIIASKKKDIIGELVIENNLGSEKIYVCFLLKYSGDTKVSNDIDNIINNHYATKNHRDSYTLNLIRRNFIYPEVTEISNIKIKTPTAKNLRLSRNN